MFLKLKKWKQYTMHALVTTAYNSPFKYSIYFEMKNIALLIKEHTRVTLSQINWARSDEFNIVPVEKCFLCDGFNSVISAQETSSAFNYGGMSISNSFS